MPLQSTYRNVGSPIFSKGSCASELISRIIDGKLYRLWASELVSTCCLKCILLQPSRFDDKRDKGRVMRTKQKLKGLVDRRLELVAARSIEPSHIGALDALGLS